MGEYIGKELEGIIEDKLNELDEQNEISIFDKSSLKNLDYALLYESEHFCLPFFTRPTITENRIDRLHFEIFFNGIKNEHPDLVEGGIEQAIQKALKNCHPSSTLSIAISDRVNNLRFSWNKVLEVTRKRDHLQGILDEEKIIINHLNRYYDVLNSVNYQIDLSLGLIFSKEISDLVVRILVEILEERLSMLNPVLKGNQGSPTKGPTNLGFKFFWNGTQKDLLELFVALQDKGWINEIPKNRLADAGQGICNLFDLTSTKRSMNSDPINSFKQILKGEIDENTGKRAYANILGNRHSYSFRSIEVNQDRQYASGDNHKM